MRCAALRRPALSPLLFFAPVEVTAAKPQVVLRPPVPQHSLRFATLPHCHRCADVERAFSAWRQEPDLLVGFFPRLITPDPPKYYLDGVVFQRRTYNTILTKGTFMTNEAFEMYWGPDNDAGTCAQWAWAGFAGRSQQCLHSCVCLAWQLHLLCRRFGRLAFAYRTSLPSPSSFPSPLFPACTPPQGAP